MQLVSMQREKGSKLWLPVSDTLQALSACALWVCALDRTALTSVQKIYKKF